jgi:hypothetical protein
MSDSDGLGFEVVDTITVYVLASDGVLVDLIDAGAAASGHGVSTLSRLPRGSPPHRR